MNFFVKYKRVFLILTFLLFVSGIAYLLYLYFFKPSFTAEPPEQPTTTGQGGRLTPSPEGPGQIITEPGGEGGVPTTEEIVEASEKAEGGLTKSPKVSEAPVLKPVLDANGNDINYYNRSDGKFYRLNADGQAVALSDKVFHNVENITWSPTGQKAVLEYPDGSNIVYNFNTGKQATLPKHWEDFDFSPQGDKLIMKSIGLDVENRWLAISNDDGSGSKPLEFIGKNAYKVIPSWSPNEKIVAMYTKDLDFNRQEVFFVGQNKENFKSTIVEGRGFDPMWAKDGERLAYSVYELSGEMKPELWVVDADSDTIGSNRKKLNIQTWASKCTFADKETMYCGVPEYLEEGSGLFPEMAKNTRDNLFRINVRSGEKELVAIPEGNYNMNNLVISQDGKNLYFTDSQDSFMHKIEIK